MNPFAAQDVVRWWTLLGPCVLAARDVSDAEEVVHVWCTTARHAGFPIAPAVGVALPAGSNAIPKSWSPVNADIRAILRNGGRWRSDSASTVHDDREYRACSRALVLWVRDRVRAIHEYRRP